MAKKAHKTVEEKKSFPVLYFIGGVLLVAVVAYALWPKSSGEPGRYDALASCLAKSGTKMYGAWWCPHCKDNKEEFGSGWAVFEQNGGYVECSTPDGKSQTDACRQAGVESYPTWRFPDGSELKGARPLAELAAKAGCQI